MDQKVPSTDLSVKHGGFRIRQNRGFTFLVLIAQLHHRILSHGQEGAQGEEGVYSYQPKASG